jgi:hypothetical protein
VGRALDEAIQNIVDEVRRSGGILRISEHTKRLARAYADEGVSSASIDERLLKAAVEARVPVEWGDPQASGGPAGRRED